MRVIVKFVHNKKPIEQGRETLSDTLFTQEQLNDLLSLSNDELRGRLESMLPKSDYPENPATLNTAHDYESAPIGTVVFTSWYGTWIKLRENDWENTGDRLNRSNFDMAKIGEQDVIRRGWFDKR